MVKGTIYKTETEGKIEVGWWMYVKLTKFNSRLGFHLGGGG